MTKHMKGSDFACCEFCGCQMNDPKDYCLCCQRGHRDPFWGIWFSIPVAALLIAFLCWLLGVRCS